MQLPGVHIETLAKPQAYSPQQIDRAAEVAGLLGTRQARPRRTAAPMTIRTAGLAAGVTLFASIGCALGAIGLADAFLSQRYEDWQAKRALGSLYPADWRWPGMPL